MTRPRMPRLAALLLAGLAAACGRHQSAQLCQLPEPQASALPTLPVAAGAGQSQAIHFGVRTAGQTVAFDVPAGTASVTIVEQGASAAVPLTVRSGTSVADNTPVPLSVDVTGVGNIFFDVPMPPDAALRKVPPGTGLTVLDPVSDPNLAVYFLSSAAWAGALTLPNTTTPIPGTPPGAGVPAGTWTVTVSDWAWECRNYPALGCTAAALAPSAYDVTVILKPAAAPSAALKVVFYLVTNGGLTAANARSNADVQRLEWAVGRILSGAGITPAFQYRDVPVAVRLRYATGVDADGAGVCGLGQLLQHAEAGNQLNVFLVDRIRGGATGEITTVGIDPIVPGLASFGGTPASGVVVSIEDLGRMRVGSPGCVRNQLALADCGDDRTADVVVHEAGHFMGLYHTTEAIGTIVDPIADTATCLCPLCKPAGAAGTCQGIGSTDPHVASPYQVLVSDCLAPSGSVPECGGGDNLMFWLLEAGSEGTVSAGQAAVMRASPLVE
ncbi:MAG TPA: hypothetical protein VIV59_06020 [Anaeromyxobacteraceae bacterium]